MGSALCASDFVIPRHTSLIHVSLDGGTTFDHVEPVGGRPDAPRADHAYRYEVTGEGEAFYARRRDDGVAGDYGVLRITLYRVDRVRGGVSDEGSLRVGGSSEQWNAIEPPTPM